MWVGGKRPVAAEVREVMWQARQEGQPELGSWVDMERTRRQA
jgi:hypothetical protein